jgi:hypothetical protein
MRHVVPLVLLAFLLSAPGTAAAQEIKHGACYKAEIPRSYGPVKSITATLDQSAVQIQYTEWDVANTTFLVTAECSNEGPRLIHCGVECDGGRADIALTSDGKLAILAQGINSSVFGQSSRLAQWADSEAGTLAGLYLLDEVEGEQCDPTGETLPVTLDRGDDTPAVAAAEKLLNDLGFLLEKPDNVYSDRTADAVSRFQAAFGLAPTGTMDPKTARKLISATAAGGGC